MKNTNHKAIYESPVTELLNVEFEGSVLTQSTATSSHNPYTSGEDINF